MILTAHNQETCSLIASLTYDSGVRNAFWVPVPKAGNPAWGAESAVQETVGSIIQPCQINVAILGKQIA